MRHCLPALLMLALSAACNGDGGGGAPPTGQPYSVQDSAGVRVVTQHEGFGSGLPRWTLDADPEVAIGAIDGEDPYLFARMDAAVGLSDGRIAIVEGGTQEIRYFDETGSFLRSAGGRGAGPGEFRSILELVRGPGDTLVVWDEGAARITWLSPEGELVRTAPRPSPGTTHYGALLGDGSRVLPNFMGSVRPERPGPWRPTARLVLVAHATGQVDSIGVWRGEEMLVTEEGMPEALPAPREMLLATSGTASHFAVVDTEHFDVGLHSVETGAVQVRIRRSFGPSSGDVDRGAISLPALAGLHMDPEGRVWVEEYPVDGVEPDPRFTIFGVDGVPLARLEVPPDLEWDRILEVQDDALLVVRYGELGVPRLHMYRIVRSEGPRTCTDPNPWPEQGDHR